MISFITLQAQDFHLLPDTLIAQKSASIISTIKCNSKGDFVMLYANCIIEVRDKDTNLINLDYQKSKLYDVYYPQKQSAIGLHHPNIAISK